MEEVRTMNNGGGIIALTEEEIAIHVAAEVDDNK